MARTRSRSSPDTRRMPEAATLLPEAPETAAADVSAAWFGAPLRYGSHVAHCFDQMQRIGTNTAQAIEHDAEVEREEAHSATSPQDLMVLQANLMAGQCLRLAKMAAQIWGGWFDLQTCLVRDAEAAAALWLRPFAAGPGATSPLGPVGALCSGSTPAAQDVWVRLWTEAPRLWLNAIAHDLQREPGVQA